MKTCSRTWALIATAAGLGTWLVGITKIVWPAHPQLAGVIITVVVYILVLRSRPTAAAPKRS